MADSVRPVIDAGLADWVASDHAVTAEVRLEPTPGHTPGHVSVRIRSQGDEAVITGDLMHHPIQCCEPGIAARFDVDPAQARETRLRFLREQAARRVLVLGTHFSGPDRRLDRPRRRRLAVRRHSTGIGRGRPWLSIAT